MQSLQNVTLETDFFHSVQSFCDLSTCCLGQWFDLYYTVMFWATQKFPYLPSVKDGRFLIFNLDVTLIFCGRHVGMLLNTVGVVSSAGQFST